MPSAIENCAVRGESANGWLTFPLPLRPASKGSSASLARARRRLAEVRMRLIRLFLQTSPRALLLAVLVGLLAGLVSTYIIIEVNNAVAGTATIGFTAFAALVFVRFAARLGSTVQLQAMAQGTMYRLRITLARRLLATPLRKLEELGP